MSITIVKGNILDTANGAVLSQAGEGTICFPEKERTVIVHQCNCKTTYGLGLYADIAEKYPYADVYSQGIDRIPGNIAISIPPNENDPIIVSMFAQINPGKAGKFPDSAAKRLEYFAECLRNPFFHGKVDTFIFPYMIGCGLAGGKWDKYYKLLEDFAYSSGKKVIIVQL